MNGFVIQTIRYGCEKERYEEEASKRVRDYGILNSDVRIILLMAGYL